MLSYHLSKQVIELVKELVRRPSISPDDAGCQSRVLAPYLEACGFKVEHLPFGAASNFWAFHGNGPPFGALAGHTDVVPPGPLDLWTTYPFQPQVLDDRHGNILWGRGASDMKGPLAAMVVAAERFVVNHPNHKGSLCFLVTSAEESGWPNGTKRVIEVLKGRGQKIDWCIVGEPSSNEVLGDEFKNGRRGSLSCILTVRGIQGHVAYPDRALNPIHKALPALAELAASVWDQGNDSFPPTSFQITNVDASNGSGNVIPAALSVRMNFRYGTAVRQTDLQLRVTDVLNRHGLNFDLVWVLNGEPFLTAEGKLLQAARQTIRGICGVEPKLSTSGGTSDGRFIAQICPEVIEIGPPNATIHKPNECVKIDDLCKLVLIYYGIFEQLLL